MTVWRITRLRIKKDDAIYLVELEEESEHEFRESVGHPPQGTDRGRRIRRPDDGRAASPRRPAGRRRPRALGQPLLPAAVDPRRRRAGTAARLGAAAGHGHAEGGDLDPGRRGGRGPGGAAGDHRVWPGPWL